MIAITTIGTYVFLFLTISKSNKKKFNTLSIHITKTIENSIKLMISIFKADYKTE